MRPTHITKVFDDTLSYIIANNYKIGDTLPPEAEMADEFGVSRLSIREGLGGLKALGMVKSSTRRGTQLCPMDFSRLSRVLGFQIAASDISPEQLVEARLTIELGLLDIVIDKLTPEEVATLHGLADCAWRDESPEEVERGLALDRQFHQTLLELGRNEALTAFSRLLAMFFTRRHTGAEMTRVAAQEHGIIVSALEDRNLELARGVMRRHILRYLELPPAEFSK